MLTDLCYFRLWNYDVCNDHEYGDHWNGENFSIYSVKKAKEDYLEHDDNNSKLSKKHLYDGGRVLEAALVIGFVYMEIPLSYTSIHSVPMLPKLLEHLLHPNST